jgi:AAHS family 4-hydroxybenzoate transporter-like MFS transporter
MDQKLDVATLIDSRKPGRLQYLTFVICFFAILIDGFSVQIVPYLAPALMKDIGIEKPLLGTLVSAGLLGMALSGLICGLLADKIGRRKVIIACLIVFGALTAIKGLVHSYNGLLLLQFISGFGLGGAYPNVLALTAEYAPVRVRSFTVTCVSCAFPAGGIFAGYFTAAIIPTIGWQGIFFVGGGFTLVIAALSYIYLPESVRYLALKATASAQIARIMAKIAPDVVVAPGLQWMSSERRLKDWAIKELFQEGRAVITVLAAIGVMMSLISGYFVISWSPLLFNLAGVPLNLAVIAGTMLPAGAVLGALIWGRLVDRIWPPAALAAAAVVAAICYCFVGHLTANYKLLVTVLFIGGTGMGVQNAYNGFIASLYPTRVRGTALGFSLGTARIGSILGPFIGGTLLAAKWSIVQLYYVPAAACLIAVLGMLLATVLPGPRRLIAASRNSKKPVDGDMVQPEVAPAAYRSEG